jgi:Ni/Co efflux regulator RcnB
MKLRTTKLLMTIAAIGALAAPTAAQARHGSDDGAGHVRHGVTEARHHHKHKRHHHVRKNDDGARHVRHTGNDDGPNHK